MVRLDSTRLLPDTDITRLLVLQLIGNCLLMDSDDAAADDDAEATVYYYYYYYYYY